MDRTGSPIMKCEELCMDFCNMKKDEELELCMNSCMKYCLSYRTD